MLLERRQRFAADMMLDALGVRLRDRVGNANRLQELDHHFVPMTGLFREPLPRRGEEDRSIRERGDEAGAAEALQRAADGDVRDTQPSSQIDDTRLARRVDELRDHLDVVLRRFLGVLLAGAGRVARERGAAHAAEFSAVDIM